MLLKILIEIFKCGKAERGSTGLSQVPKCFDSRAFSLRHFHSIIDLNCKSCHQFGI